MQTKEEKQGRRGRPRNPLNTTDPYARLAARRSTVFEFRKLANQSGLTQDDTLRWLLGMEIRSPTTTPAQ